MKPPVMWLAIAFGVGLWAGLVVFRDAGSGMRDAWVLVPVFAVALVLWRQAPLGAAMGVMGVAGLLWGEAAVRERGATCAGEWGRDAGSGMRDAYTRAAIVRLVDPAPDSGGLVDVEVVGGAPCGGGLRVRWPERPAARGGTTWVVAGRFAGDAARGVLVARRVKLLDGVGRGRGALRDRIVARVERLFGARAPLVEALVIARRTELDPAVRDRYAQAGLAHLLAISGLHVGFLAGWLGVGMSVVGVRGARRLGATGVALAAYVWLLGAPAPATRAVILFLLYAGARWRQRVVAPAGLLGLTVLLLLLIDPWAAQSVGAWLSPAAARPAARSGRGRHAPHGADYGLRLRDGRADRCHREPRRHSAGRGRGAGPRRHPGDLVGRAAPRAPLRRGLGARPRAIGPSGARSRSRTRRERRDDGWVARGDPVARRRRGGVVAVELPAPPLALRRPGRLCLDGFRFDVSS